jgi:thioredoxin reductase
VDSRPSRIGADTWVIGSGAAGMSAGIEGARVGRRVVLVDSLPALGPQYQRRPGLADEENPENIVVNLPDVDNKVLVGYSRA